MIPVTMLALGLLAQSESLVTATIQDGFTTTVQFEEPRVESAWFEGGEVLSSQGASARFVPGEPVVPVRTLFVPVPSGSEPVLSYSVLSRSRIPSSMHIARAPLVIGAGLETEYVPALPADGPSEHAVLAGVIPLAGATVAVIEVYPAIGERPSYWAESIAVDLVWDDTSQPSRHLAEDHLLSRIVVSDPSRWLSSRSNPDRHAVRVEVWLDQLDDFWRVSRRSHATAY